jgi:uncharacterized protein (DUF1501 family)
MHDHRCDHASHTGLDRRGFLGLSLGGFLGLSLGGLSNFAHAQDGGGGIAGFGSAEHLVILWMNGAASQMETWDPKPGHKNGGPTKAIKTRAKGLQIAHTLPRLAEHGDKLCVVRSMATGEGNHQRARYFLHTGYVPSGTVRHPDIGALICQQKAEDESELPAYISLNGAPGPGAGVLGVAQAPFRIQDPTKPVDNLAYAKGVDEKRFARRRKLLSDLGQEFGPNHGHADEVEGHDKVVAKADRMMHSKKIKAFDLGQESESTRAAYGKNKFGQGCLMARRLIEQGTKVVEVQLNGWDTHKDNFTRTTNLTGQLDLGFSALLKDLSERDLLQKTLVVCMSEFGRTPRINENEGRDHYAKAWSMAMAGGMIRGGQVIGATSPDGLRVVERPLNAQDLMASIAHATGIDGKRTNYTKGGRPIQVIDTPGRIIPEFFKA